MNNLVIQVFLSVLLFGTIIIMLFFIFKNIFSPKKISTLKSYIKNENYKASINLAKEIINKDRNNIEAHYYLGDAYYNQKKYELALIEFRTAEKKGIYEKIDERKLRERLAELYTKVDKIDEALKEYVILTKKHPNDYIYFYKVGELFEQKDMEEQAMSFYSNSIKLNSNYIPALLNMGVLLYKIKKYPESNNYLQMVVRKDPNNYKGFFYLGMLKKIENNHKDALKFFEKSSRDKEYKMRSLTERGMVYMIQAKYDEAIVELDRALKSCEPENNIKIQVQYLLASCYEQNRNITEAISLWEQIYAKKSNFRDVSEKLSNYQELRTDDRMKDFLTATDIDFLDMCKGIIFNMGMNIVDQHVISKDIMEFLCLEADDKWRNVKKKPKLIHISRKNSIVDEVILRKLNEKMREDNIIRGVIISSSSFSKLSIAFAKERPIELIDKTGLQKLLKQASA